MRDLKLIFINEMIKLFAKKRLKIVLVLTVLCVSAFFLISHVLTSQTQSHENQMGGTLEDKKYRIVNLKIEIKENQEKIKNKDFKEVPVIPYFKETPEEILSESIRDTERTIEQLEEEILTEQISEGDWKSALQKQLADIKNYLQGGESPPSPGMRYWGEGNDEMMTPVSNGRSS